MDLLHEKGHVEMQLQQDKLMQNPLPCISQIHGVTQSCDIVMHAIIVATCDVLSETKAKPPEPCKHNIVDDHLRGFLVAGSFI
jgi:hypothetical protein